MRYPSIDVLRMAAIFLMVLVHFTENLSGTPSYALLPTGFGAPMFAFLSGVSYRLWVQSQEGRGRSDDEISKRTIRRGLFLLGLGFAFNIFVWLPEDTYNWDVLTFIGVGLMFLNVARKLDRSILLLMCVMALIVSPLLRATSDYDYYWENGYFKTDLTLTDVLLGFLSNGYFPILPWLIFPVTGFVVASLLIPASTSSPSATARLGFLGAGLVAASGIALALRSSTSATVQKYLLTGWTMFPPSTEYCAGALGFTLLAFLLARRWIDSNPRFAPEGRWAIVARTFSAHSLSIYVLHHLVHLWPLWIYGTATGHEATHYWQSAMPATVSLPLSLLFVVLCYLLFRWMDRTGRGGIERLMRWVCD